MSTIKRTARIRILLFCVCLSLLLSACVTADCSMQAVAGGSAYCEQTR